MKKHTPLVSIVTPSYNQAQYLESTIFSVLNQDYSNIEYIIIDGGSTDGSRQIINKYASRLACWVSEDDRGQADAINKGMARAKGEILAWLNSDDIYLPDAVGQAVDVFNRYPEAGLIYGNAITIDQDGKLLNPLIFGDWGIKELLQFRIICQPAVFFRRSVWEKVGSLDLNYQYMLDHHLWLRMSSITSMVHVSKYWAAARHHPAAKNVAHAEAFAEEIKKLLSWITETPGFKEQYLLDRRRIEGGGNRLIARYYLDGELPGKALRYYFKALYYWPAYALRHWYKMLFAFSSLFGGAKLGKYYYRNLKRNYLQNFDLDLDGWYGIQGNSSLRTKD
ncbi:MAG: glycosyltransferase [Anaerolineales bacterium]|nr:glycosyltransferase [Anaerolineales bacterium]